MDYRLESVLRSLTASLMAENHLGEINGKTKPAEALGGGQFKIPFYHTE